VEAHRLILVGSMFIAVLTACGGAQTEVVSSRDSLSNGDPTAPPSLRALPDVAKGRASERVQLGMSLARQVLETRLPEPPTDHSYQRLQLWIDQDVVPWVSARRESVEETRFQFGLDHGASSDERVVANAVLGLLQEDTALSLANIPSPAELDTEPEVGEMFRDLVRTQSQPFQSAAASEYHECATNAYEEGREFQRWAVFCHTRFDRLEAQLQAAR
jgi:hypothetical protein